MSGSTIGGIVGGTIGFFVGGPAGAKWGFELGSIAGGIIKPQTIQGRQLGPPPTQSTQLGAPIPKAYGRPAPFYGTLLDGEKKARKIVKKTKQGKGGPTVKNDAYLLTYAILFGEEIDSYLRLWRNEVCVYDRRQPTDIPGYDSSAETVLEYVARTATKTSSTLGKLTLYTGTRTQNPDPALEVIHGVGNTPAYRGRAYIVIVDDDVTDVGGVAAQWKAEVIGKEGATQVLPADIVPTPAFHYPLNDAVTSGAANELIRNYDGVYSSINIATGPPLQINESSSMKTTAKTGYMVAALSPAALITNAVTHFSAAISFEITGTDGGSVWKNLLTYWADEITGTNRFSLNLRGTNNLTPTVGYTYGSGYDIYVSAASEIALNTPYRMHVVVDPPHLYLYLNGELAAQNDPVTNPAGGASSTGIRLAVGGDQYPASTGAVGNFSSAKGWEVALTADQVRADYLTTDVLAIPDYTDAYYDYRARVIRNATASHYYYSVTKPSLQSIVEDIAGPLRCGIPTANFTAADLASIEVPGYLLGQQVSGLDLLGPLQQAYFWDYASFDGQLHARARGGAVVCTITDDDLLDTGDDAPETTPSTREFPLKVSVTTQDPAAEYAELPQTSIRTSTTVKAANEVNIRLPIPLPADEAMQIAEKIHNVLWTEAEGKLERSLPEEFSRLVPTDSVYYPDSSRRWYLTRVDEADGEVKIEAKLERLADLTSAATGITPDAAQLPDSQLYGPTIFQAMNLPPQRTDQNVPGIYVAAQGVFTGWKGCEVLMSLNSGTSYESELIITEPSVMGYLTVAEPGGTPSEPITVRLYDGADSLESVTALELATGKNQAAILKSDGTLEVIGWLTATENADGNWELSDITRHMQGTSQLSLAADDVFVLLDTTRFIPIDPALAGTTLYLRAVTAGTAVDANPIKTLVYHPATYVLDGGSSVL